MSRLSRGEVYHLERSVDEAGRENDVRRMQDQFLDLFIEWRRSGSSKTKAKIMRKVDEIKALDPNFAFEFPEESEGAR